MTTISAAGDAAGTPTDQPPGAAAATDAVPSSGTDDPGLVGSDGPAGKPDGAAGDPTAEPAAPPPTGWRRHVARVPLVGRLVKRPPVVPVVRLGGVIGQAGATRRGLSLAGVAEALEEAFTTPGACCVALVINSPGGAPVQSSLIQRRVRALAEENRLPVIAFTEDVAASGGYWLACAGDEIIADENSIIGSIGVISAGFGFTEAIAKIGVERRVHTAGAHKGILDPFTPEDPDDVARLAAIQADIHESFKAMVRDRRAGKLTGPEDELFSGAFWTGRQAWELGLVDGLGNLRGFLRERYGKQVKLTLIEPSQRWPWSKPPSGVAVPGGIAAGMQAIPEAMLAAVEERAWWARYGL